MYACRHEGEQLSSHIANNSFLVVKIWGKSVCVSEHVYSQIGFPLGRAISSPVQKGGDTSLGRKQVISHVTLLLRKAIVGGGERAIIETCEGKGNQFQAACPGRPGLV